MFGPFASVRIKAGERALREGRVEDALRIASTPEIAAEKRGRQLLGRVADAMLERAREHYRAERFTEALIDIGHAEQCAADPAVVAELRDQVLTVARDVARQQDDRRRRVEEVQRCLQQGSLAAGEQVLQALDPSDPEHQKLAEQIAERRRQAEDLVARAERGVSEDDLAAAVKDLCRARRLHVHHPRARSLQRELASRLLETAWQAYDAGRWQQAATRLATAEEVADGDPSIGELRQVLEITRAAAEQVATERYEDVEPLVRRMQALRPAATWIGAAADELARLEDARLTLISGPLGDALRDGVAARRAGGGLAAREALAGRRVPGKTAAADDVLTPHLLVLVEGGGSYLLCRASRVTIGRAAASDVPDLPIFSDLSERHAEIMRVEDDYFLNGAHEVEVAGRRTRHQLLRDGDRIVLGRRAKMTLRIPSRRSISACLDLSDSTRMPNDVRRVILFKDTAIVGRGRDGHIQCSTLQRDLLLYERGSGLYLRSMERGAEAVPIEMGTPTEVEGVRLVVKPWTTLPPSI